MKKIIFIFGLFILFLFLVPRMCFAYHCCSNTVGDVIIGGDGYCCDGSNQYYCKCIDVSYWSGTCNDINETFIQDCNDYDGCIDSDYYDYYCSGGDCTYSISWNDWRCVKVLPDCPTACHSAGYDEGLCFYGSTSCSAEYPDFSGNNCFHNCSPKTGTSCDAEGDTCLCFDIDSNKLSCNHYSSGSTCYYNGAAKCLNSGWECDYDTCNMRECCDCTASGCEPNTNNCTTFGNYFICDLNCYCQGPDLYIVNIEEFGSDKHVHYEIRNKGDADAGSSRSYLYIDGSYEEYDSVSSISDGSSRDEYFPEWKCTLGEIYDIEVCADKAGPNDAAASEGGDIDEENENNNCKTETLTCPGECTGTLNVTIIGSGTCSATADITAAEACRGKSWAIKEGGTTISGCSGTIPTGTGTYNGNDVCSWGSISQGDHTYDLYIDGNKKYDDLITCPAIGVFDFSISISPTSGSTPQDGSVQSTVTVTLISGTTQSVSFYTSGLPSGASDSFSPSSCNPTCNSVMTISTSATTPTGIYQITVCGTTGTVTHCYSYYELTVTEAGAEITPPQVRTVPISEKGTVSTNSATIWGELTKMGGASSCLVWFEWGTTTSLGNKTPYQTRTFTGYFPADISGLTSNKTYYFEAFAKNGGSW